MAIARDDLVEGFWKRAPERAAQATELWLTVEAGSRDKLVELRRLLHTIKGEAQMLAIEQAARMLESSEKLVDSIVKAGIDPGQVGDALLGAFEALGLLASNRGSTEVLDVSSVDAELKRALALIASGAAAPAHSGPPAAEAPPQALRAPIEEPEAGGEPSRDPPRVADATIDVDRVVELFHELRRLHGEQALLLPDLSEVQRRLRALMAEMHGEVEAEALRERIVKTLGYGAELERRLTALRGAWSANEFSTTHVLESLHEVVQRASLVSTQELKNQVHLVARSTAKTVGKEITVEVSGDALMDAAIERILRPCLLHMVRNAVDHGIESAAERKRRRKPERGKVLVTITQTESSVRATVEDDGGGIDFDALRASIAGRGEAAEELSENDLVEEIFRHGVSTRSETTEISGRGVGLDVVAREIATVGGHVKVESSAGIGTRFVLTVPATLRADMVVPLRTGRSQTAVPTRAILEVVRIDALEQTALGPRLRLRDGSGADRSDRSRDRLVSVYSLGLLLEGAGDVRIGDVAVVLQASNSVLAVTVDSFQNPRPVTFHRTDELAFRSSLVRGVSLLADGGVMLLLDVDRVASALSGQQVGRGKDATSAAARTVAHVLVVEDAPVARELLTGVLRSFGLRVTEAVDGRDGIERAKADPPDLVLTDIEMPYVDGLEMIALMREDPRMRQTPIIVLTTRTDPDTRARASALGVRGFLSKQKFVEHELRDVVDECLRAR